MNGNQGENEDQGEDGKEVFHSKKPRSAYVTGLQKQQLVAYVERNYGVLYGNAPYKVGEMTKDELWTLIAMKLNAVGPNKNVSAWKRCYASIKSLAKRKLKIGTPNSDIGTYSTPQQRQQLVDLVSQNYDALFGRLSNSSNGDLIKKKVWKVITDKLNSLGPKKDVDGWIRCFSGLKSSTKEKLSVMRQNNNRKNQRSESGGLNAIQSKMVNMHDPDVLDGSHRLDEMGIGRHTVGSVKFASSTLEETGSTEQWGNGSDMDVFIPSTEQHLTLNARVTDMITGLDTLDREVDSLRKKFEKAKKLREPTLICVSLTEPERTCVEVANEENVDYHPKQVQAKHLFGLSIGAAETNDEDADDALNHSGDNDWMEWGAFEEANVATDTELEVYAVQQHDSQHQDLGAQVINLSEGLDALDREVVALQKKFERFKNVQKPSSTIVSGALLPQPEQTSVEFDNEPDGDVDPDYVYRNETNAVDSILDFSQQTSTANHQPKHRQVQQAEHLFGLSLGSGETNNEEADQRLTHSAGDNDCMEWGAFEEANGATDTESEVCAVQQNNSQHRDVRQYECRGGEQNPTRLMTSSTRASGQVQVISNITLASGASLRQSKSREVLNQTHLACATAKARIHQKQPSGASQSQSKSREVLNQTHLVCATAKARIHQKQPSELEAISTKAHIERREVENQSSKRPDVLQRQWGKYSEIQNIIPNQEPGSSQAEVATLYQPQRPQRRGVEINLDKYVEARRVVDLVEGEQDGNTTKRRNRLSVPLGVMATDSLDEQKTGNDLLAKILLVLSNRGN